MISMIITIYQMNLIPNHHLPELKASEVAKESDGTEKESAIFQIKKSKLCLNEYELQNYCCDSQSKCDDF